MTSKGYIVFILILLFSTGLHAQSRNQHKARTAQQAQSISPQQEERQLALQYYRKKNFEKAAALFEKLYHNSPTHSNYNYLFYSLLSLQEYNKVEKIIKRQIRKNPNIPGYQINLGYLYITKGETKKGERIYNKVIKKLKPNQSEIRSAALTFRSHREDERAIETYLKARELLNDPYIFGLQIGTIYDRAGLYKKMFDEYLRLLAVNNTKLQRVKYRIQNSLNNDPENIKNDFLREALLTLVHQKPDKRIYIDLLLWLSIQQKDFEMALIQTKALDKRFTEDGENVLALGDLCVQNQQYTTAIKAFTYVMKKGDKQDPIIITAQTKLLIAKQKNILNTPQVSKKELYNLKEEYIKAIRETGKNRYSYNMLHNLAHLQAIWLDEPTNAIQLLQQAIAMGGISKNDIANSKLELADIYLFTNDPWEATLLYSQVEKSFKNEPLGHKAKYKNAMLSFYIGEYKWAKAQFKVLKAATSKLIANDAMEMNLFLTENMENDSLNSAMDMFAAAKLLIYRNKTDSALQLFDTITSKYKFCKLHDDILFSKAEILKEMAFYTQSDSLFTQVFTNFAHDILADNAIMQSAEINQNHLHNTTKAVELYKTILTDYSGSLFADKARKQYRILREKQ